MACGGSSSSSASCGKSKSSRGGCGAPAPSCGGGCEPSVQEECCAPIPDAEPFSVPAAAPRARKSAMEKKILCGNCPVEASGEEICVNGIKGIYVNKDEVDAFNGPIPIEEYEIFNDPNPKIINKVMGGDDNVQEVKVKFLVAPAGPEPGDIIIRERPGAPVGPAPPVIIRQEAEGGSEGKPQCFRECPPKPCPKICPQLIEVCAKGTPPPRKVIIEKMPAGGSKPGPIYAERWLSASSCQTRNVVYYPAPEAPSCGKVRNVIINWTREEGSTKVNGVSLGPKCTDPTEYKRKYGRKMTKNMPEIVNQVAPPAGTKLAGSPNCDTPQLTGCVSALKNVDLAEHGLEAYADQVANA